VMYKAQILIFFFIIFSVTAELHKYWTLECTKRKDTDVHGLIISNAKGPIGFYCVIILYKYSFSCNCLTSVLMYMCMLFQNVNKLYSACNYK
jgi:hypothetical protein